MDARQGCWSQPHSRPRALHRGSLYLALAAPYLSRGAGRKRYIWWGFLCARGYPRRGVKGAWHRELSRQKTLGSSRSICPQEGGQKNFIQRVIMGA